MARRLIESLRGTGAIHAGQRLLRVARYELSVWTNEEAQTPGGDSKTDSRVDGHLDITGIAEAVVLTGPESLTLTLEDGRRLAFQLTSSDGAISGGWLPQGSEGHRSTSA